MFKLKQDYQIVYDKIAEKGIQFQKTAKEEGHVEISVRPADYVETRYVLQ